MDFTEIDLARKIKWAAGESLYTAVIRIQSTPKILHDEYDVYTYFRGKVIAGTLPGNKDDKFFINHKIMLKHHGKVVTPDIDDTISAVIEDDFQNADSILGNIVRVYCDMNNTLYPALDSRKISRDDWNAMRHLLFQKLINKTKTDR